MSSIGYTKAPTRIKATLGQQLKTGASDEIDKLSKFYELDTAVVHKVIMKSKNPEMIGVIYCRPLNKIEVPNDEGLIVAYPLFTSLKNYPVENEMVLLGEFGTPARVFYIPIMYYNSINYNGNSALTQDLSTDEDDFDVENTFLPNKNVLNVTPRPGDVVLQGRFGSGIKFTTSNTTKSNSYKPTVLITNDYRNVVLDNGGEISLTEDINKDGSTILLINGELDSAMLPQIVNTALSRGNTLKAFEKEYYYRDSYREDPPELETELVPVESGSLALPTRFDGQQLVLSSDRVLLTSKSDEILILGTSQVSIYSDSRVTIDSKLGFEVSTPHAQTRFRADHIYMNSPNIFLGVENDRTQPALMGENTLVYLEQFLFSVKDFVTEAGAILKAIDAGGQVKMLGLAELFNNFGEHLETRMLDGVSKINPKYRSQLLSNKVFIGSNEIKYSLESDSQ